MVQAAFAAGVATVLARAPNAGDWARLYAHYAERGAVSRCPGVCSLGEREAWRQGRWAARVRLTCLSDAPLRETVQVLVAAQGADAPAVMPLEELCTEAERWFKRYE